MAAVTARRKSHFFPIESIKVTCQLGFAISSLPGDYIEMPSCPGGDYDIDVGDHILAQKPGVGKKLLLMGHLDTVFPPDSPFQSFRREADTMYGPGVADMQRVDFALVGGQLVRQGGVDGALDGGDRRRYVWETRHESGKSVAIRSWGQRPIGP